MILWCRQQLADRDADLAEMEKLLLSERESLESRDFNKNVLQKEQELLALGCACINSASYPF